MRSKFNDGVLLINAVSRSRLLLTFEKSVHTRVVWIFVAELRLQGYNKKGKRMSEKAVGRKFRTTLV